MGNGSSWVRDKWNEGRGDRRNAALDSLITDNRVSDDYDLSLPSRDLSSSILLDLSSSPSPPNRSHSQTMRKSKSGKFNFNFFAQGIDRSSDRVGWLNLKEKRKRRRKRREKFNSKYDAIQRDRPFSYLFLFNVGWGLYSCEAQLRSKKMTREICITIVGWDRWIAFPSSRYLDRWN